VNQLTSHYFHPRARAHQAGVSLVELMVAMAIGIFLLGAVGIIYVNTTTTSRASTLESQMNEDASLALEILQQQIRLAGYSTTGATGSRNFSGVAVRGCDGGFGAAGANNGGTVAFSTLACDGGTGADSLAVRYEATALNSQTANDAGAVLRPDNCSHNGITPWVAGAAEGSNVSISLADNRYYVANDAANNNVPSLFCRGRDGSAGGGFSAATALIPNIEDMQIRYGITNAMGAVGSKVPNQVTAYVDAGDTTLGAPAANWARVMAIRICLLARSANPVPTGSNSLADIGRYADCNGTTQTPTDRFLRRAFVTTILLRNMRPQLPAEWDAVKNPYTEE
jgi:type IV pilus assembly protein PilW